MLEPLFNKVAGLKVFIKKETLTHVFSCEICQFFKNIYFEKHLQTTAFDFSKIRLNSYNVKYLRIATSVLLFLQVGFFVFFFKKSLQHVIFTFRKKG